ncbi:CRISPR-associated protein Csx3 [Candidatus Saccharibacteria bacterium]|nr:CRISPR-associated protein Csx3 [Candidatus Saccharibacteria bacterium]
MAKYNVAVAEATNETATLKIGFGEPASNDQIVVDAKAAVEAVSEEVMGKTVLLNGPASLPVAVVLTHALCHICPAIAVFDPKLGKYVVSVSHTADYQVGDLL